MSRAPRLAAALCLLLAGCSSGTAPATAPPQSPDRPPSPGATGSAAPSVPPRPPGATPAALTPAADGRLPGLEPAAMYSGDPPDLGGLDSSRLRVMVVTGDLIPARLTQHALRRIGDWGYPFAATRQLLGSGDLTVVDLEAPLIPACPDITTGFQFCGDPRIADGMAQAHVGIANVANNHIANYGAKGLAETQDLLLGRGMAVSGLGRIGVADMRGLKVAVVGFNLVGPRFDAAELGREVAQARAEADIVAVEYHWGREYETFPLSAPGLANDDPRQVGRATIDAGADIVLGNHPHCVQGGEVYQGRLITYAHGNYLFDQDWSVGTQESVIGRYYFYDRTLVGVQYVPLRIAANSQPRPLDPRAGEGRQILDRMLHSARMLLGQAPVVYDGPGRNDACP